MVSVLDSGAEGSWVQIAVATLSGNSVRQTVGDAENAGLENAGLENTGPNGRGGKSRTGKRRTKFPGQKTHDNVY